MSKVNIEREERLDVLLESVKDHASLSKYVGALKSEFEKNSENWENITVEDYLFAIQRWLEAFDQLNKNLGRETPSEPTWQLVGILLSVPETYE